METTYNEMEGILQDLNEKWNLDFTSATMGNCCSGCVSFNNSLKTILYDGAETYLIVKWYESGMNYGGTFEEYDLLHVSYELEGLDMETVCNDLEKALQGRYTVERPESSMQCILLKKV